MAFRDRLDNGRSTLRREVDVFRDVLGSIKERFDADSQTEPSKMRSNSAFAPHGTLLNIPPFIVMRTLDNVVQHGHRMGQINRAALRR